MTAAAVPAAQKTRPALTLIQGKGKPSTRRRTTSKPAAVEISISLPTRFLDDRNLTLEEIGAGVVALGIVTRYGSIDADVLALSRGITRREAERLLDRLIVACRQIAGGAQ